MTFFEINMRGWCCTIYSCCYILSCIATRSWTVIDHKYPSVDIEFIRKASFIQTCVNCILINSDHSQMYIKQRNISCWRC